MTYYKVSKRLSLWVWFYSSLFILLLTSLSPSLSLPAWSLFHLFYFFFFYCWHSLSYASFFPAAFSMSFLYLLYPDVLFNLLSYFFIHISYPLSFCFLSLFSNDGYLFMWGDWRHAVRGHTLLLSFAHSLVALFSQLLFTSLLFLLLWDTSRSSVFLQEAVVIIDYHIVGAFSFFTWLS